MLKTRLIGANLPGRTETPEGCWLRFTPYGKVSDGDELIHNLRRRLSRFCQPVENRAVYFAMDPECENLSTAEGEEPMFIFTVFINLEQLSVEECSEMNSVLLDLFGPEGSDLQSEFRRVIESGNSV